MMPDKQTEATALQKLEELLEKHLGEPIVIFTKEEAEALRRVAARERAWMALGTLAGSLRTILTYLGFFLGAWVAFKAGVLAWLAENLGGLPR